MKKNICTIICGAPCGGISPELAEGFVIAADRGCGYALRAGITPDLVAGDLDSFCGEIPEGIELVRVPPEKDDTDAWLAAEIAVERGFTRLRFLAALGGRLDHTFANFQMIYGLLMRGVWAELYGECERAYMVSNGAAEIPRYEGYLSVFAFGGSAVVSEEGTKYPLDRHRLFESFPLGVSNEITAEKAVVTVHSGTALIIEHRAKD